MLFYFLCGFVIVTSAFPEGHIDSENVPVSAEDGAAARIAGGEDPDIRARAAPYQAQITREGATFCSGTIINHRYIVTAAHCVDGARPRELTVRVGSNIRGEGLVIPIEEIVQHPDYDYPLNNFDIAYMRTAESIPLLPYVTTLFSAFIASPGASVPKELHVTGWGYQEDNQMKLAENIRAVDIPVISNTECQVFYPMMSITKNMICLYSLRDMDKGTCVGDGGDPATVSRRLVGVSSFTRGCGPGMGPSVFTYVDAEEIREFIINGTSETDHPAELPQKPSKRPERHPQERPEKAPKSPAGDEKAPKSPAGDEKAPKSPAGDEKPPKTPAGDDKAPKSPEGEEKAPKSPVGDEKAPKSPAGDEKAPKSPEGDEKAPKSPAGDEKATKSPASDEKAPKSPASNEKAPKSPVGDEKAPKSPAGVEKAPKSPADNEKAPKSPAGDEKAPKSPAGDEKAPKSPASYSDYPKERPVDERPEKHPDELSEKAPRSLVGDSDDSKERPGDALKRHEKAPKTSDGDSDYSEELNQIIPGDLLSKRPPQKVEVPADRPEEL